MSYVNANQPDGTPTWIDLGVPDHERAMAFYGAVFGWDFKVGPPGAGGYVMCLLHGRPVAAIRQVPDSEVSPVSPSDGPCTSPLETAIGPPSASPPRAAV
jgi:uncharacterized protein